jgi:hypothetical protein
MLLTLLSPQQQNASVIGAVNATLGGLTLNATGSSQINSGQTNVTLAPAGLSSTATKANGTSGSLTKTLSSAILSAFSSNNSQISASVNRTLSDCSLISNDFSPLRIYQEIWIIQKEKPKKRVKRAQRKIREGTKKIAETIEQSSKALTNGTFAAAKISIDNQLSLLESNYKILDAEIKFLDTQSRLLALIEEGKAQARRDAEQRLFELEQVLARQREEEEFRAAERARKEQEELTDLNMLLDLLMAMDFYDD